MRQLPVRATACGVQVVLALAECLLAFDAGGYVIGKYHDTADGAGGIVPRTDLPTPPLNASVGTFEPVLFIL